MGDERAETYLRLVAEREFRRVIHPPGWADHRMSTSDIAASALWNLRRAGRILIAAAQRPAAQRPTAQRPTAQRQEWRTLKP